MFDLWFLSSISRRKDSVSNQQGVFVLGWDRFKDSCDWFS